MEFVVATSLAGPFGSTLADTATPGSGVSVNAPANLKFDDELRDQMWFIEALTITDPGVLGDQARNPNGNGNGGGVGPCNDQGQGNHNGNKHCDGTSNDEGQPVPEPTTMVLLGAGLLISAAGLRRRK